MIHNTLPDAALGAADLHGLRPHAAGPQFHAGIDVRRHSDLALLGISLNRSCITGESEIAYLCCISSKHVYMEDS